MRLYRSGSGTRENLTPKPKDLDCGPGGTAPGLSLFDSIEKAVTAIGKSAQVLDLDRLQAPLRAFPDDLSLPGSIAGHFAICPVGDDGRPDLSALREWVVSRGSGGNHALTQLVINAIVDVEKRKPT